MFENKKVKRVRYSRYIASWINVKYSGIFDDDFRNWLKSEGLNEDEMAEIYHLATCGKLELENSIKTFLNDKKN